jgi:D-cysteine desulfhydrase
MRLTCFYALLCVFFMSFALGYPLFEQFPQLTHQIPYKALGTLPTPVHRLEIIGKILGHNQLYVKCDDLTGAFVNGSPVFGGNKVRKLEILLADALNKKAASVLTMGCAGSNHALATAWYAQLLKLPAQLVLAPQCPSDIVRRNLLLDLYTGATIIPVQNRNERLEKTAEFKKTLGDALYVIPVGGSVPLGSIGYVNAVFELKDQIKQGLVPEPDVIYVAIGSGGTAAGLILGVRAAGLKSIVRPIAVDTDDFPAILGKLVPQTNKLLHDLDKNFPLFDWQPKDFVVETSQIGKGYGVITPEAKEALELLKRTEGIVLEGTYSAKAFAAVVRDITSGGLEGKKVLFWNTFSAGDFADIVAKMDYHKLPVTMHHYFEETAS